MFIILCIIPSKSRQGHRKSTTYLMSFNFPLAGVDVNNMSCDGFKSRPLLFSQQKTHLERAKSRTNAVSVAREIP